MNKRCVLLIGVGVLTVSLGLPGMAAEPIPALAYDFSQAVNGSVPERTGSGLDLALGKKTRTIATEHGTGLEFDGSEAAMAVVDPAKFKQWVQPFSTRELAVGVWMRLDASSSSPAASLGLFDCRLDSEKRLRVRLAAKPDSRDAVEYVMRSRAPLNPGQWYHVEFNYSQNRRRASLYIDGRYQTENNNLALPELALGELKIGDGFRGAIADFRLYDAALNSEDLAIGAIPETEAVEQARTLADARKKFGNRSFAAWCSELAQRLDRAKASQQTTLGQWRRLKAEIANAATLAAGLAENRTALSGGLVTAFIVPAISQEIRLPYSLPTDGELGNQIQVAAALGEFEPVSFVVVPFAPVQKFEIRISDLKCGSNVIPASEIDAKLVKRWYRCGGAWLSYHADKRQRVLVPSMLVNDDALIKVDEVKQINLLRLSYPDGTIYRDVSQYSEQGDPEFNYMLEPVKDAPVLQAVALPEAGRNQQFWLTCHVPQQAVPGLYDGVIRLLADGQDAGELKVCLRVLPFALPEARTYYDLDRVFYGQLFCSLDRHLALSKDPARVDRRMRVELRNMRDHNALYPSGPELGLDEKRFVTELKLREEAGLPNRPLFTGNSGDQVWRHVAYTNRTDEIWRERQAVYSRGIKRLLDVTEKTLGHREVYFYGNDEAGGYLGLVIQQEPSWNLVKELGGKTRAAGWSDNLRFVVDNQDMHSITSIDKRHAEVWHAAGGRLLNYADPFASAENPLMFRRKIGMMMYLAHYDGTMLLSYCGYRIPWNEFARDPGGDGNYRSFAMTYPKFDGVIDTLAWEGMREGFDDIRYATLLKQQAAKGLESRNRAIEREAKRQLAWLAQVDGATMDLDSLRLALIDRILTMRELQEANGGK